MSKTRSPGLEQSVWSELRRPITGLVLRFWYCVYIQYLAHDSHEWIPELIICVVFFITFKMFKELLFELNYAPLKQKGLYCFSSDLRMLSRSALLVLLTQEQAGHFDKLKAVRKQKSKTKATWERLVLQWVFMFCALKRWISLKKRDTSIKKSTLTGWSVNNWTK